MYEWMCEFLFVSVAVSTFECRRWLLAMYMWGHEFFRERQDLEIFNGHWYVTWNFKTEEKCLKNKIGFQA